MIKKIYTLAALIIVSLVLYGYLSSDYYAVQYGTATGDSICTLNAKFDCRSVAASKYSNMAGVPNALLGFMLSFVMLISLFGITLSSDNEKNHQNWLTFSYFLFSINAAASVVMGSIALFAMDVYCIFCMALYAISFLLLGLFIAFFKGSFKFKASRFIGLLKNTTYLSLLIAIPALGFLGHKIFQNEYSPSAMTKQVNATVRSWKSMPSKDFSSVEPMFVLNPGGKVKIAEFADFLCPHCSTASKSIKGFLKTHNDVEFSFYAYPLDGQCNSSFDQNRKYPGFSCTLAKGVLCAQKQGQGVSLHNDIFERQNDYRNIAIKSNNEGLISEMLSKMAKLDEASWKNCLNDPESTNRLQSFVKLANEAGVKGTPTIYVNGKKLDGGANFLVLKAAHDAVN